MREVPDKADVVIIGGGAVGLSVAAHLGWRGASDVVLLERAKLTSGTSWHAAGIVGPLRATMNQTRLALYAVDLFGRLEAETGLATGYHQTGGLWLAQTPERIEELRRIADIGLLAGLGARMVTPEQAVEAMPLLAGQGLAGALWVDEDGQADPVGICMAYAAAARAAGVRIVEDMPVADVEIVDGKVRGVRTADGRTIACNHVVNCAGAWAHRLAAHSGVAVPLQAVEHMYVVTEPVPGLPTPCPIVRDLDARIYVKEDAGRLVLGGFEPDAKLLDVHGPGMDAPFLELPEDWDQFTPFMQAGLARMPVLSDTGIQHFMNGPESFTPDTKPLIGPSPEVDGYWVAAGFNSLGIVSSAGAGRVLADWIVDGLAPMDLGDVDIARFEPDLNDDAFLSARTPEAVSSQFDMHWPFKRPVTGRDLRRLPAHDVWAGEGAVFGAPGGWERPLWFGPGEGYGFGAQPWWPAAERESLAARDRAVVVDLSPFSKFEISGLDQIQRLCSADMDMAVGRCRYTLLLNERGGIEAEATVTRLDPDRFLMVGAAPSRRRDLRWLARHLLPDSFRDVTRDAAVLGLFGPEAGGIWKTLGGTQEALRQPYGTSRVYDLGGVPVRAVRLSYIGEFGWEIYLPWHAASDLAGRMLSAGAAPMGLMAVEACRIEQGFRHWGHDMGPEEAPVEVGLGFACAMGTGFIGETAVAGHGADGTRRRLRQFEVEAGDVLLLHDEPVFSGGALVGQTTSGGRGFRTGQNLCFALISPEADKDFEVQVAGRRYRMRPLDRPPYDRAAL